MFKNTMQRLIVAVLIMGLVVPPTGSARELIGEVGALPSSSGLYRTRVAVRQSADWARLERVGVTVLEQGEDWALVLVDEDQLETLARLRFEPEGTDELGMLVTAHAQAKPWLADSLRPLLAAWKEHRLPELTDQPLGQDGESANSAHPALTPELKAGLATLSSVDDDADGLTNTQEQWWCTDPLNPNSDGDAQGYTDGDEVTALLDFTLPRSVRWGYGPPFGPPNAWPDWNGEDGDPNTPACNDGDYDTIPDFAEVFMVGSRVPAETTDGDKFDDGQELFGVTYCPGAPTNCGYGSYPGIEYWNYIKATMPNWVRPPGDNLFVAAFPVPEVFVVPGSWTVQRVTIITTQEGEMVETTNSYETSVTRGQSTSIANTVTWNEWEEVSEAVETPLDMLALHNDGRMLTTQEAISQGRDWLKIIGGGAKVVGGIAGGVGACLFGGAFTFGASCVAGAAGGLYAVTQGLSDIRDGMQEEQEVNKYNVTNINNNVSASAEAKAEVTINQNFDFQGIANSLDGVQYAINLWC